MSVTSTMTGHIPRGIMRVTPTMVALVVVAALMVGWAERDEQYLTPQVGTGYWLGIYGSVAMLLMLIYSARKRVRFPAWLGSIPFWFRVHMLMGVAGPVLILFHANFALGALNSNVALFTMLTVAGSGVVGRYLYRRVHASYSGHKARIRDLLGDIESLKRQIDSELIGADRIVEELDAFGRRFAAHAPKNPVSSLLTGAWFAVSAHGARARLIAEGRRFVRRHAATHGWSRREQRRRIARIADLVRLYVDAVRKAVQYSFYERLFALWHFLHLPLFVLMILAAIVHVWAVHRY